MKFRIRKKLKLIKDILRKYSKRCICYDIKIAASNIRLFFLNKKENRKYYSCESHCFDCMNIS